MPGERLRLRPALEPGEAKRLYPAPHDHRAYGANHDIRVRQTVALASWLVDEVSARSAADLSCGNGEILAALPVSVRIHGDFAPGWELCGPIERTIREIEPVDLFVCSETIEHLEDPDSVLGAIREVSRSLILSTPIGERSGGNPEHLWGWDAEAVREMIGEAGWSVIARVECWLASEGVPGYDYQLWACR